MTGMQMKHIIHSQQSVIPISSSLCREEVLTHGTLAAMQS